jgi:hypothetical protein
MTRPALGLLLDVDGPIASPVSRSIAIPAIIEDLVGLTAIGVPIAFITGRSDAFIREQVMEPLLAGGLAEALEQPGARMFAVFEKGAAWSTVGAEGLGEVTVDATVAFPPAVCADIRELVATEFADTMFYDETKRAMISVEQRTDVPSAVYRAAQDPFQERAFEIVTGHGIGLKWGSREVPDAAGLVPFRIDPTIISTDIESVLLDKDRGAERALEHFARDGELPEVWRSVGDSRSDYKMADYVHSIGYEVAHVDVRPADGILDKPYQVITEGSLIHDAAGAAFLAHWAARLGVRS